MLGNDPGIRLQDDRTSGRWSGKAYQRGLEQLACRVGRVQQDEVEGPIRGRALGEVRGCISTDDHSPIGYACAAQVLGDDSGRGAVALYEDGASRPPRERLDAPGTGAGEEIQDRGAT